MSNEGLHGDWPAPQHTPTTPEAPGVQHVGAQPQAPAPQHAAAQPQPAAAQHAGVTPQPPAPQHGPSPLHPPDPQHVGGHAVQKVAKVSRRSVRFLAAGGAAAAFAAVVFVAVRKDDQPSARPLAATSSSVAAATGSEPITPGSLLAGSVTAQGDTTLPFTARAGTVSYFAAAPNCTATELQWDVEDMAGVPLGPAAVICGDVGRIDFVADGTYRVHVYSVADGGTGEFSIERKESRPDKVGAITAGETVTGDIDLPGARDVYDFDASEGTVAWFASPECSTSELQWVVEDDAGTPVGAAAVVCGQVGRIAFTTTGRFHVRVYSVNGGTGTYSIAWEKSRPDHVSSITSGQTISGTIDLPGAQDLHEFDADAGMVAYFAAAGDGCVDNGAYWVVEDDAGVAQTSTAGICGDLGRIVFATSGRYRVRVYSVSGGVGPYEFGWLTSRRDTVRSLPIDGTARGNIDLPGSHDVWTFRASAGQTIAFSAVAADCTGDVVWTVQTADGTAIAAPRVICDDIGQVTIPTSGDYQVVVTAAGQTTAAYAFETQQR